jgi:hypothetical protein
MRLKIGSTNERPRGVLLVVGQNKICHDKPTMDKCVGRTKCPRRG